MFNHTTLTTEGSKRWIWAGVAVILALVIGFILYGRSNRQPLPAAALATKQDTRLAHLAVINLCDFGWRIVAVPAAGGETRIWQMAGAATLKVDLPAGDYTVNQTMLVENPGPEARRSFPMLIEPGQTYRWRLATLLSGGSAEARVAAPAKRHE